MNLKSNLKPDSLILDVSQVVGINEKCRRDKGSSLHNKKLKGLFYKLRINPTYHYQTKPPLEA